MTGYCYIQPSHRNFNATAPLSTWPWITLTNLAAFLMGGVCFHLARTATGSIIDAAPAWAYRALAIAPGILCLALVVVPRRTAGRLRWPLVVAVGSSVLGGVLGHLTMAQNGPAPWPLLVLPCLASALWLATLRAGVLEQAQEEAQEEAQLVLRRPVHPRANSRADRNQRTGQVNRPAADALEAPRSQPPEASPLPPVVEQPRPAPPPIEQPRPVQTEQPAAQPEAEASYSFPRSYPKTGLAGLAGMADLKAEIRGAIAGFRGYARGGQVHDRNGILLSGPPGNGKTAMAAAIAGELGLPLIKVGVQDLTSKWINESAAVIKSLFQQAAGAPCVLFFDEFDSVAASRAGDRGSAEDRKVVTSLLKEIDDARAKPIVLVAATNFADQIDPAIARDGRFDFRIEIPFPDGEARAAILSGLLRKFDLHAETHTISKVARLWERRSVSFIDATVKRLRDAGLGRDESLAVEDFKEASQAASRLASAIPSTGARLSEIALPADVREQGRQLVRRLRNWESVAEQGGEPPSGVMLYGPPGTGKTHFVRALARELGNWHVFEVNAAEVIANPRKFRDTVELAATHRPAFVFIDEADELLRDRTHSYTASATNEILKSMDGFMGRVPEVVFIAATNNLQAVDAAALRGGRFAEHIYMDRLRGADLVELFRKLLAQRSQVKRSREISAERLAAEVGEIAPADAVTLLNQAVNATFTEYGNRPLTLADIRRAHRPIAH